MPLSPARQATLGAYARKGENVMRRRDERRTRRGTPRVIWHTRYGWCGLTGAYAEAGYMNRVEALALLKRGEQGVAEWNIRRRKARNEIPNFRHAYLTGADLSEANLSRAILAQAHLRGAKLHRADLTSAHLSEADLSWAKLVGAHLSGAKLRRADLAWADLSGANLVGAHLSGANLVGAYLNGANLNGANLKEARLKEASLVGAHLGGANLFRAELGGADLSGANLTGAKLDGVDLSGANLRRANLSWSNLAGANLSGSNFCGADAIGAKFAGAHLSGADLNETNLTGAHFRQANLSWANLIGAKLSGADLIETKLHRAKLQRADLMEAKLHRAELAGADLTKAVLTRADLIGADLIGADLSGARCAATVFADCDLSSVNGLDAVDHHGPSPISSSTLRRSKGKTPESFLRGCGLSPWELLSAKAYDPSLTPPQLSELQYEIFDAWTKGRSMINGCFICYSSADSNFVDYLRDRLMKEGVNVWLDRHDMVAGSIQDQVWRAIQVYHVVVLVLSEASIRSDWVENELDMARTKEKTEGRSVLCPIALDEMWKEKVAAADGPGDPSRHLWLTLTQKLVVDFSAWRTVQFNKAFEKLLRGLKVNYGP